MAKGKSADKKDAAAAKSKADDDVDSTAEGEGEGAAPRKRALSGKRLVLFIILPVVLLLGAGGAHFAGLTAALIGGHEAEEVKVEPPKPAVFFNLPEMLVNLNSAGKRPNYLKITVSLELDDAANVPKIESMMPRIVDNFQVYLRELRIEDLRGSAGLYRLREELLARVNLAVQPAKVNDVLFKEMLVQ